jgi:hypothetical protein
MDENFVKYLSVRRQLMLDLGSYNDKNDGFCRTFFSRSKNLNARIRKVKKLLRIKPIHKQ